MQPNPFFLSRNTAPHYGDRIEFAAHVKRSLSIKEATELCAHLAFLIADDEAVGKHIDALRGKKSMKLATLTPIAERSAAEKPVIDDATATAGKPVIDDATATAGE